MTTSLIVLLGSRTLIAPNPNVVFYGPESNKLYPLLREEVQKKEFLQHLSGSLTIALLVRFRYI